MDTKEKLNLAEWASSECKKHGADQVTAVITSDRSIDVSYRDKKIESLEESTQCGLSLNIYTDNKYSSHTTSDLRRDALAKFIQEAVASTKYLSQDKFRKLPDPKLYPKNLDTAIDILDQTQETLDSSERVRISAEIEEAALAVSDKIISVTSGYSDSISERILVQSNGFSGISRGSNYSAGCSVTVKDGEKGRPEDWCWGATRFFKDLPSPNKLGKEGAERALAKIGQKKIESGKYLTLVENRSAGRILNTIIGPMSARAIQQKSSYLDGQIGKKIASEKFTLIDDPFIKRGLGSRLFDNEGIATRKRVMIEKGVLQQYYVDNYYGAKAGLEPNSGTQTNLLIESGNRSYDDIIKDMKKGIIIHGFIGGNSNSTTGDFSFGIMGLLVEDGKIVMPINEMNISGNAKELWNQLVEAANDPYPYSSWQLPSLLFENIDFSGL